MVFKDRKEKKKNNIIPPPLVMHIKELSYRKVVLIPSCHTWVSHFTVIRMALKKV